MITLLIIIHFIPAILMTIAGVSGPYTRLNSGSTLNDYFNGIRFPPFVIAYICSITPILNWILFFMYAFSDDSDENNNDLLNVLFCIWSFIKEFLFALKLLIIWMFGLKYVFKFLNKIFSIKIK